MLASGSAVPVVTFLMSLDSGPQSHFAASPINSVACLLQPTQVSLVHAKGAAWHGLRRARSKFNILTLLHMSVWVVGASLLIVGMEVQKGRRRLE